MNITLGKFYLLCYCIVPIVLPASSQDLKKITGLHSPHSTPACSPSSRVNPPVQGQVENLSDITSQQFIAISLPQTKLENKSACSSPRSQKSSQSRLSEAELKEIFKGYTPGKNNRNETRSETSSISAEIVKASFNKETKKLTIPELIRNSAESRLKKDKDKKVAEKIKSHEQKMHSMQNSRNLIKVCALATSIATSSLLIKSEPRSRFGVGAAMSIVSMLPSIAGGLGAVYALYRVDRALHYGSDVLREDVKKWRNKDSDKIAKQFENYQKIIDQEIADRIQGDKDVRKAGLTNLDKEVGDLQTQFTEVSRLLGSAQSNVAHARDEIATIVPQVHAASQNSQDLKAFIATQIFPTIQKIQQQVGTMRAYNEHPAINPLADSIEYAQNLNQVYISSDSDEENSAKTPPTGITRSNALRLEQPKNPTPPVSADSYLLQHADSFQNQFRRKKPGKK